MPSKGIRKGQSKSVAKQKSKSKPKKTTIQDNKQQNKIKRILSESRPKSKDLKNIKKLDKNFLLIRKKPFQRLVKETLRKIDQEDRDLDQDEEKQYNQALFLLQQVIECRQVDFITDGLDCTHHAKRVTLMKKDLALARRIRGNEKLTNIKLF